jgi:hypothetical protein
MKMSKREKCFCNKFVLFCCNKMKKFEWKRKSIVKMGQK